MANSSLSIIDSLADPRGQHGRDPPARTPAGSTIPAPTLCGEVTRFGHDHILAGPRGDTRLRRLAADVITAPSGRSDRSDRG